MKKQDIFAKLAALLLLLTTASCCLLSSMFARYTENGADADTSRVAVWRVDGISKRDASKHFGLQVERLGPTLDGSASVHSSIYVVKNYSEVAASVSMTLPAYLDFYVDFAYSAKYEGGVDYAEGKPLTLELVRRVISVEYKLLSGEVAVDAPAWEDVAALTAHPAAVVLQPKDGENADALTLKVSVVWETLTPTSIDLPSEVTIAEGEGDLIDTAIGMNVHKAKAEIQMTATQVD